VQRIHGLVLRADLALPGIAPASVSEPDIVLELVDRLPVPMPTTTRYRAAAPDDVGSRVEVVDDARGHTAFRYGDGTAFDVDHRARPARIRAAIAPGQTLEDLTAYLYGPVLGFVLRAWGRLALHASGVRVRVDDGAVLLAGGPGAGKSTTAAALATRGHTVVSDDLTAVSLDEGTPLAWPAFDHLRLWPSSEPLVLDNAAQLERITPTWDKRRFPLEGAAFADGPCPIRAIVVLRERRADARALVRTLAPARAVVTLATLTYANYLLDAPMRARELMQLGALVRAVPILAVTPPMGRDGLKLLCGAIVRAAGERAPVHT
jgi:hypothetical protein